MKKGLLLSVIMLAAVIAATGCSAGNPSIFIQANWHSNNSHENVVFVDETLEYKVEYSDKDKTYNDLTVENFSGSYTTRLTVESVDGVDTYKLTDSLNVSGDYVVGETRTPFADEVKTEVWFKGIVSKLTPVKSTRDYKGHTPLANGTIEYYEYKYSTEYTDNSGKATLVSCSENIKNKKESKTYNGLGKKSVYFDNEQLLFVVRAFDLKENFSQTFTAMIPLDERTYSVKVSVGSKPYETFNLKNAVKQDGALIAEDKYVSTIRTSIVLNETMNGKPYTCHYAVKSDEANFVNYNARLMKMEMPLVGIGSYIYTLTSVDYTESRA